MSTFTHDELAELVLKARTGDRNAFRMLYEATARMQYIQILQKVSRKEAAEEILQQVYTLLLEQLDHIQNPHSLVAYLNMITSRECVNYYRRQEKTEKLNGRQKSMCLSQYPHAPSPEEAICKNEEIAGLHKAIAHLGDRDREILLLRYAEQMKIQDIANIYQISASTVKRSIRSALSQLRGHMQALVPPCLVGAGFRKELRKLPIPRCMTVDKITETSYERPKTPGLLAAGSLIVAAAASLVFLGAAALTPISITSVSTEKTPTKGPLFITISLKGFVTAKKVEVSGVSGTVKAEKIKNDRYLASVTKNGTYSVTVISKNGHRDKREFYIDQIDNTPPRLEGTSYKNHLCIIKAYDRSGIKSVTCRSADGKQYNPVSTDKENGIYRFDLPYGEYDVILTDTLDNTARGRAKLG